VKDAFGNELNVGDQVLGIANFNSTQTFYYGEVLSLTEHHADVRFTRAADAYIKEYNHVVDASEKRIALSHRLVKL
jgi:hypothetical protein